MMKLRELFSILCLIILSSCKHEPVIPETPAISYQSDIQPIIIGNCTQDGCHGNVNPEDFSLLNYDEVMSNTEIRPKNAQGSKLYKVINGAGEERMPRAPNSPLTDQQIQLIYLWIMQGAKNN